MNLDHKMTYRDFPLVFNTYKEKWIVGERDFDRYSHATRHIDELIKLGEKIADVPVLLHPRWRSEGWQEAVATRWDNGRVWVKLKSTGGRQMHKREDVVLDTPVARAALKKAADIRQKAEALVKQADALEENLPRLQR